MSGRDSACQAVVERASDYMDGALAPSDRARVERHLDACPGCAGYLAQMRATIAAMGRLGRGDTADLEPAARAALVRLFRTRPHGDGARPL